MTSELHKVEQLLRCDTGLQVAVENAKRFKEFKMQRQAAKKWDAIVKLCQEQVVGKDACLHIFNTSTSPLQINVVKREQFKKLTHYVCGDADFKIEGTGMEQLSKWMAEKHPTKACVAYTFSSGEKQRETMFQRECFCRDCLAPEEN